MKLGAFSVSLAVKNIELSYEFYKKLGFEKFHGDINEKWLILKNGETTIGLFEGMFEDNIMTFNPGWSSNAETLDEFDDVRKIEEALITGEVDFLSNVEKDSTGPGNFMIKDPDGNTILFDQHV
jgi:predicted lactoylglutathione lyase